MNYAHTSNISLFFAETWRSVVLGMTSSNGDMHL